jgi:hypothetical protein
MDGIAAVHSPPGVAPRDGLVAIALAPLRLVLVVKAIAASTGDKAGLRARPASVRAGRSATTVP